jgi:hypothetical protein
MKTKNKLWLVRVPPFLDKELREFIQRNNASRINFIRKSIRILCEDNPPQQDRKRGVSWLISLHPSLHKKAIEVAKANYPSKTAFIRFAVLRQLTAEIYLDEKTTDLLIDNRKLRNRIAEKESDNERLTENYYDLLAKFRHLKAEYQQLKNLSPKHEKICTIRKGVLENE